ncbi:carboxypeptidase-like regulatory domain-containing protein [Brumimicrobium mesophilum]|uniref:carboxypeptidase-like regulatory domain-containing protein n=1 Tax=Brumimicrobium mesophilum TaxID=392717 RepID=UPI000D144CAE|nr:carboxypeptidase-like regulatory domain-containing protein [Brumimicrobium mesophilum]
MTKALLLILLSFNILLVFAQNTSQGVILDGEKKVPVEYAKIRIKNTYSGVMTNVDGAFRLSHSENDSLIISHVFYNKQTISVNYFKTHDTLFLYQKIQNLPEATIIGSKGEMYDLVIAARENLSQIEQDQFKAFLSIESYDNQTPIEMIQAYYNAEVNANGISDLQLKTGRIGLNARNNQYFVSLGTSNILLRNKLLSSKQNKLPLTPLQVSKRKLRKKYRIHFISVENGLHKYHLVPHESKEELFEAYLYINKGEERIYRIEYAADNIVKIPFVPINPTDSLDSINVELTYNYSYTSSKGALDNIEMNYDFIYKDQYESRKINSHCLLLLYDNHSLFKLPFGTYNATAKSDYEKITFQPFNELFWKNNEVICPSKKAIENEIFFQKNGVLINLDSLKNNNDALQNKVKFWESKRMFLDELNGGFNVALSQEGLRSFHNFRTLSDMYNLDAKIFLDQNKFGTSTQYILKTIINLDESFYYLKKGKNTICFINLYFDIFEVHRRRLEGTLNQYKWRDNQVDSLYQEAMGKLKIDLDQFVRNANRGQNETELMKYIEYIKNELSIDNSLLIEDKELLSDYDMVEVKDELVSKYNYGSALLKIGEFQKALIVLSEVEKEGDEHPWLFYNMGICYLELEQQGMACKYFFKSEENGEILDDSIKKKLCSE